MPYIPRMYTGTTGVRPELNSAIPYQAPSSAPNRMDGKAQHGDGPPTSPMLPTLSVRNFQMPVERVVQALFGKKMHTDENTRGLVPHG